MKIGCLKIGAAFLRHKTHAVILSLSLATGLLAAFAPQTATAASSWSDSFETYAVGSQMHNQGGWRGWDNVAAAGALVVTTPAHTGTKSVAIAGNSDLVQEYTFATAGKWIYTAWQFIPTTFAGTQYFILMNTYQAGGSQLWSAQVWMDTGSGKVGSDFDGAKLPLVKGRWVELRVEIDLTADVQKFYYDNQLLYQKSWTAGVSGGGARSIAAVDLYANGTSAVYYDDISLQSMNQAPVAQNQSVTNAEDTTKAITLIGTDADNDALTYTIVANPAHGTLSGTSSNVTYTPATNYNGSDSFTFRVSDSKTNSNVATVSLTVTPVNDAPTVIVSASPTNETAPLAVNFTAIGTDVDGDPLTYSWNFGDGTTASIQNPSHSYTTAGTYTVTVTVFDGNGGSNSTQVVFTITSGPPSITLQPADVTNAAGQTATFTVAASGTAPLFYQWYWNGEIIVDATGTSYTTPPVTISNRWDYFYVSVTNLLGSDFSDLAMLTVTGNWPSITFQPADVTVAAGQTATFTVAASGAAPMYYQWFWNGEIVPDATGTSYTTPPVTISNRWDYFYVSVTNPLGSDYSYLAMLTVTGNWPSITLQPSDVIVATGQVATFTVAASGAAPMFYQWYRNGVTLAGATGETYTTPPTAIYDDGAWFYASVTNLAGAVDSDEAWLSVTGGVWSGTAPTITLQPASVSVSPGQTATFAVAANGDAPLLYQWYKDSQLLAGATGTTYTTPHTTTNDIGDWYFHVVVYNLGGTVVSDDATLSIALPTVALPVAFCEDVTVYSNTAETITLYGAKFDPTNGLPIPGVSFTYCVVVAPTNGTLSVVISNEVTYTPFVGYVGPDQFTYRVNDGFADSEPAVIAITVTNAIPGPPPTPTNEIPPNVTHGVPPPVITPSGGTFSDPLLVTIAPPTLTPISGTPGWRTGVRFPGASLEQAEALSHDGLQVMALRARTVCSNMYTFASVNLSPEAGAPIPLYVWSLTDFGTANYPPDLLIGVTDNLGWDGNSRSISSSSNSNRVYLMFRQNTHGSGAASPELYSCAAGLSMTLSSQNLATFEPLVIARLETEPLRFEYAGDKVRVTVSGQPLTCAATDENGWVTYIGDAASGRVTAPLGATRFWVSLAGGYMSGLRELVLADWAKPETRYTFDNSAVTETSPLVPGPLRLTYDTTLRARCFSSPLPGSVETSAVFTCAIQPFPAESYISPVYLPIDYAPLDGSTPQISVTGPSGTVQAGPAQDLRYPLDPAAPTPLTLHRSGAQDVSGSVVWRALDLGNAPDMHICRDDSMLLTAGTLGQTGTLQIVVYDSSNQVYFACTNSEGAQVSVLFNRVGIFHATAYINGISVGSLTIYVSYVDIKGPIACQVGYQRVKDVIVQAPSNEVFFTANVVQLLSVSVIGTTLQGFKLGLRAIQRGSPVLEARLGSPTGPLIARQPVDEFTLESSAVPGIVVVDNSESGPSTLRMRPYIPGLRFDFSMFASSSSFYGGLRTFSINTSDATAPTGEPGFQAVYDPFAGETVGIFNFTLEVPANETSYCFSSNPFQNDAALSGNPTAVAVGANDNNNGCKCTIIALNTLTFMNSTSDESTSTSSLSYYIEPWEWWAEQARDFAQIGANTCNPPPTYYVTLTLAGAQNDERDLLKRGARFANGTQISPPLQCLSGCQSLAYLTGTKYGLYTKQITVDSSKVKLPINQCKENNTPGKVDVSVEGGKLVVARLDANGPLPGVGGSEVGPSPQPGTRDQFPRHVEMMTKRSGKLYMVSNISGTPTLAYVGEPVIIIKNGGEDAGFGTPSLYGVECGNHTWEFQAQDGLADISANLRPNLTWKWSVDGTVAQAGSAIPVPMYTVPLATGRHIIKLEYFVQGQNTPLAKAEIHSIVVEPKHSENVADFVASTTVFGKPFEMRGKCFGGMKMDASLHVDAHARVSLDGYPQNEYWGGVNDDKVLAQVLPLTHDQPRLVYLQGYKTPSASASDKATLSVKGQGLREWCTPDTCNDKLFGKQVKPFWEDADTEKFLVINLDLDTDSDNVDDFGPPSRDPILEDAIEDYSTLPGKIVGVNDDDSDADGIPDFADGFDWDGWSLTAAQQKDDTSVKDRFVQLILEAPQPIDLSVARLRITYNASDPAGVTKSGTPAVWQPAGGSLRIWKKDANQARNKKPANAFISPGDYVPSGVYKGSELGLSGSTRIVTLYVEGIKKSSTLADQQIKVEVDPLGWYGPVVYMAPDAVRFSVLRSELDGLRVYDPKLAGAGSAEIKYKIEGPASGIAPKIELTVMDGATEVACIVRRVDPSPSMNTLLYKYWDGKWGVKKDGTDTTDAAGLVIKGKLADPKKYRMELKVYASDAATTATLVNEYNLYVVRLGVLEMGFLNDQEVTYHKSTSVNLPGLVAVNNYSFTDNNVFGKDVIWKTEHLDFLKPAGPISRTEARVEQTPTGESYSDTDNVIGRTGAEQYFDEDGNAGYTAGLRQANFPPQKPTANKDVSGGIEKTRYNRPSVYVKNLPVKTWFKFGTKAISDLTLTDCSVGYPVAAHPIWVAGKFGGATMGRDATTPMPAKATDGDAIRNINPVSGPYKLKSTAKLANNVGYNVETIEFTFKYNKKGESYVDANGNGTYDSGETIINDNGNGVYDEVLEDIPGKQTTTHLIYRLADTPKATAKTTDGRLWLKIVDFTCNWANGQTTPVQVFDKIWNTSNFWTPFAAGPKPDNANGFHGVGDPAETTRVDMWGNRPKCYSYQHNMGNNNGFDVDWLLDFNQGRCGAWAPFLLSFMGTHGLGAAEQNMPLMKWRFVSNTGAVSFEKNALAVAHIPANQRPGGAPAQDGDTWYKPLAIWVNASGQANPFYANSPNLVSCWFVRWGDGITDHVFVKYNGRYYDGSYEHIAGASYATINAKADAGISDYYYESKLVYEAASGGFVDRTTTMANDQIWMGPSGLQPTTGPIPLLKVPNDLTKDEMEEP